MSGEKTMNRGLELQDRFIAALRWDPHDDTVWRVIINAYVEARVEDFEEASIDVETGRERLLALPTEIRKDIADQTESYYEMICWTWFEPDEDGHRPEYDAEFLEAQNREYRFSWQERSWLQYILEALDAIYLYRYAQ